MIQIIYFVDSTTVKPQDADLSIEEKNVITKAIDTIDNLNILCKHCVSIALDNSPYINQVNVDLKSKLNILKNGTNSLKAKMILHNIK